MKKVNWIIEKHIFNEYENELVNGIKNSGMNAFLFDESETDDNIINYISKKFNNDIVIFYGSLQDANKILKTNTYPGVFLTLNNYECYNYYGYFGDYLLNSKYLMFGLNDLLRNKDIIFDFIGTDSIFIRPSNGFKTFDGQLISKNGFDKEYNVLINSYGKIDINTLVVLSSYQNIKKEYRFIVIDNNVISGSLYFDENNKNTYNPYFDKLCDDMVAWDFAIKMSKIYQPDKAYTIDVCELDNGEYKLIELNSFCCSNMYGNDYEKVVSVINDLCIKEWKGIYD